MPTYLDWLDELAATEPGGPHPADTEDDARRDDRTPARPSPPAAQWDTRTPIVVVGAHGGSGATTVALLVASVVSETAATVVLDGTPAGGDLSLRAPTLDAEPRTWQDWLTAADGTPALSERYSILCRDRSLPDYRSPLGAAVAAARAAGAVPIVDAGTCAGTWWFDQLADYDPHIVLTVADRAASANGIRPILTALRRDLGTAFGRLQIVVTSQHQHTDQVTPALRGALETRVGGVSSVPYDHHLALGQHLVPTALEPATWVPVETIVDLFSTRNRASS